MVFSSTNVFILKHMIQQILDQRVCNGLFFSVFRDLMLRT